MRKSSILVADRSFPTNEGIAALPVSRATISVISHGHGPLLHQALVDLARQRGSADCCVVVTLNLADEAFDVAAHPALRLKVLRNPTPKGFGANHNAAFSLCDSPWFIVLNPDIRFPDPGTLERLTTAPPAPTVGIVAPLVTNSAGVAEDSVRGNLTPWSLLRRAMGRRDRLSIERPTRRGQPFYWLAGMCLAVNTQAWRSVVGFDERFFLYCEDYDLCARLFNQGWSLAVDEGARVVHDAQRDSHRSFKHLRWHIESLLRVWSSSAFWSILLRRHRTCSL